MQSIWSETTELPSQKELKGDIQAENVVIGAGIKDFCIDVGDSVAGLTKGVFGRKEVRCSHLGCHLTWNEEEESWDCPCHGSRYDKNKKVIDNPAQPLE